MFCQDALYTHTYVYISIYIIPRGRGVPQARETRGKMGQRPPTTGVWRLGHSGRLRRLGRTAFVRYAVATLADCCGSFLRREHASGRRGLAPPSGRRGLRPLPTPWHARACVARVGRRRAVRRRRVVCLRLLRAGSGLGSGRQWLSSWERCASCVCACSLPCRAAAVALGLPGVRPCGAWRLGAGGRGLSGRVGGSSVGAALEKLPHLLLFLVPCVFVCDERRSVLCSRCHRYRAHTHTIDAPRATPRTNTPTYIHVCVCVCVCIHTYIYIYLYIHTHTHIYTHTHSGTTKPAPLSRAHTHHRHLTHKHPPHPLRHHEPSHPQSVCSSVCHQNTRMPVQAMPADRAHL